MAPNLEANELPFRLLQLEGLQIVDFTEDPSKSGFPNNHWTLSTGYFEDQNTLASYRFSWPLPFGGSQLILRECRIGSFCLRHYAIYAHVTPLMWAEQKHPVKLIKMSSMEPGR